MTRYFLLLISLICLTSCSGDMLYFLIGPPNPCCTEDESAIPCYEKRELVFGETDGISTIMWDVATQFKHERHLHLDHAYVIDGPEHASIRMEFTTQDLLEMCPARELLVDLVENLLDRINGAYYTGSYLMEKIYPYPFPADYLEIYINFECFLGIYVDPNFIGWIVLEDGMAYYYAFSVKNHKDNWWYWRDRHEYWNMRYEPYFKSRSFVMLSRESERAYEAAHPKPKISETLGGLRYVPPGMVGQPAIPTMVPTMVPNIGPMPGPTPLPLGQMPIPEPYTYPNATPLPSARIPFGMEMEFGE